MNHAKILDCTLRDGAYLVDKNFGDTTIRGIINGLVQAKVDFIEIGFLQDEGFGDGKTVFKNSADAEKFIPLDKQGCEFAVLADYSRYSVENLDEKKLQSIDAIRECFFKKERFEALEACKVIKEKGYKIFVQPVDILGYDDIELIEFLQKVNEIEPYCLSIVDTFGSMYQEDLHRVFEIIHHNLISSCRIGFHSHNNMQLSNALSQEFIRMSVGKREVVIDSTISGMGRGAGNTPTELVMQYMVSNFGYKYDMDALLDVIDGYMDNIRTRCSWGYTTSYFIAGCYGAHVNNVSYLIRKNSICSKDIRYILNKIGSQARKRYDYDLLERTYLELLESNIDDNSAMKRLKEKMANRKVLILVPGHTISSENNKIKKYIDREQPIVISVNFLPQEFQIDYVYMSNIKRYRYWQNNERFVNTSKILTSNIIDKNVQIENAEVVSFKKLIKCGSWENIDNSTLMLLRLLDSLSVANVALAGFDGYDTSSKNPQNYVSEFLESSSATLDAVKQNQEIEQMLENYGVTRTNKDITITFITNSRFAHIFE